MAALSVVFSGLLGANVALAKDKPCLNYYTVGESDCRPSASTPVARPPERSANPVNAPLAPSEVDKYLADYGKPPREFVEFYLNPTPENATKWVVAYQQILQKGNDMSRAWNEADQLYKAQQSPVAPVQQAPQSIAPAPEPEPLPPQVSGSASQGVPPSFGGIADRLNQVRNADPQAGSQATSLTYYFSQTCPYCARTTPDLATISNEMPGKLAFTCVDVTPVGPSNRPDSTYITSKLPCNWRLPEAGEIDREGVRQTPTLVIQKPGSIPVRLSGYVPLVQLRSYF
jgi:thiol-disulfide isomerase/thioredoxin